MNWRRFFEIQCRKKSILIAQKTQFYLDKTMFICYHFVIMKKMTRKIIQLSAMQVKQLEKIVQITGFSEAEIIRRAFDEYVERRFPDVSQYSDKS